MRKLKIVWNVVEVRRDLPEPSNPNSKKKRMKKKTIYKVLATAALLGLIAAAPFLVLGVLVIFFLYMFVSLVFCI